jgi:hypothetical protein
MSSGQGEGLHILLIVAIVITVAAGVSAVLMYQSMSQTEQDNLKLKSKLDTETNVKQSLLKSVGQFKAIFNMASLTDEEVIKHGDALAKQFGPDGEKNIPAALTKLNRELENLTDQFAQEKKASQSSQRELVQTQAVLARKIKVEEDLREASEKKATDLDQQYSKQRQEFQALNTKLREERAKALVKLRQAKRDYEEMVTDYERKIKHLHGIISGLQEDVGRMKTANLQKPDGVVVRSDAALGRVYVDLGSMHKVKPGLTFSVFGFNQAGNPYHEPKGKIEIKRVEHPDMSMAVVTEFDPSDPIVRGDRIYSPIYDRFWTERFAIVGRFDLDGDGRDNRDTLIKVIRSHGGIVVCELLADGTIKGSIEVNTNWLLLGQTPTDDEITSATEEQQIEINKQLEKIRELRQEAKDLGVSVINLRNFLSYMGYASPKRLTLAPTIR